MAPRVHGRRWCEPPGRRPTAIRRTVLLMGWVIWAVILPLLLVVAGVITLQRRRGRRGGR